MNDSILFWNAVALEANRLSHSDPAKGQQTGPALSARALAIVHLAMYDAYAAVKNNTSFPRYLDVGLTPPAPSAGATDASLAAAGAAYYSLTKLYSSQKDFFDTQAVFFDPHFSDSAQRNKSFDFGFQVADKLLKLREKDKGAGDCGYKPSDKRFRHRVDPDNPGQGFYGPFYGQTVGFAVTDRHFLDAPPTEQNNQQKQKYSKALRQVRAKGIKPDLTATLPDELHNPGFKPFKERRTAEETMVGLFWGYDGSNRLGTPPRFYNLIAREIAIKKGNDEGTNARLFAFLNAALGDAGILAWEQKYCHDLWRPVVGIREHDPSFGPSADENTAEQNISEDADPGWLPLGAPSTNSPEKKNGTPNFPSYPSGHATFGAAGLHIIRLFYGQGTTGANKKPFDGNGKIISDNLLDDLGIISEEFNGMNRDNLGTVRPRQVRKFKNGLADMIIENASSRIFLGVHWSFDAFDLKDDDADLRKNIGGVPLGLNIAKDIFDHGGGLAPKYFAAPFSSDQPCAGDDREENAVSPQRDFRGLSAR